MSGFVGLSLPRSRKHGIVGLSGRVQILYLGSIGRVVGRDVVIGN